MRYYDVRGEFLESCFYSLFLLRWNKVLGTWFLKYNNQVSSPYFKYFCKSSNIFSNSTTICAFFIRFYYFFYRHYSITTSSVLLLSSLFSVFSAAFALSFFVGFEKLIRLKYLFQSNAHGSDLRDGAMSLCP